MLDADITGPSIPRCSASRPPGGSETGILPVHTDGIKMMSINLLLESEDDAVIWRGPLIGKAIPSSGRTCCGASWITW